MNASPDTVINNFLAHSYFLPARQRDLWSHALMHTYASDVTCVPNHNTVTRIQRRSKERVKCLSCECTNCALSTGRLAETADRRDDVGQLQWMKFASVVLSQCAIEVMSYHFPYTLFISNCRYIGRLSDSTRVSVPPSILRRAKIVQRAKYYLMQKY